MNMKRTLDEFMTQASGLRSKMAGNPKGPSSPTFDEEVQARAKTMAEQRSKAGASNPSQPSPKTSASTSPQWAEGAARSVPASSAYSKVVNDPRVLKAAQAGKLVKGNALAGAALAAKDVYDVATDENSTKIDVAAQAAEGVGKGASAYLGGALGTKAGALAGGFLAPVTGGLSIPIGAAVGGLAGGAAGYFGGEKLINTLRGSESPAARLKTVDMPIVEASGSLRDSEAGRINDSNAAMLAKANAENPDLAGGTVRPKAGDSVPIDENTVRVFDGQAWVNRTSEAGKQRQALRDQQYQARTQQDYENATRDGGVFARQLRNFDEMKQRDYVNGLREQASLGNRRAGKQYADIMSKQAVIDDARATRESTAENQRLTLRSQNITAARDEARNTRADLLAEETLRQNGIKNRLENDKFNEEKSKEAAARRDKEIMTMFPGDENTGKRAEYSSFMNNFVNAKAEGLKAEGRLEDAKKLLSADFQMDAEDRAKLNQAWNLRQKVKDDAGWIPGTGHYVDSLNPADFAVDGFDEDIVASGSVLLRNGSRAYVNDLRDQNFFSGKGNSSYDKIIQEARDRQAQKDAQRKSALNQAAKTFQ